MFDDPHLSFYAASTDCRLTPPPDSPWALLLAHLANDKADLKKIDRIKEYLWLKNEKDTGGTLDDPQLARFQILKALLAETYFVKTDFTDYLERGPHSDHPDARDFAARLGALKWYLEEILNQAATDGAHEALHLPITRAVEALERKAAYVRTLQSGLHTANQGPGAPSDELLDLRTVTDIEPSILDNFLAQMLPDALAATEGRLATSIDFGVAAAAGRADKQLWLEELLAGMQQIFAFLNDPDAREDLTLIDLTFYVREHRGASEFRGSTSGYYAAIDALIAGLVLRLPSFEKTRQSVDSAHTLVDPKFQDLCYALKLAAINAKHHLGFTSDEIDVYGTLASMVGSVMRGFGIDEIDDRFKQYLHNTGDHSLRTLITLASVRDTIINRLSDLHARGKLAAEDLATQTRLAEESARHRAKWAVTHDIGEFLGELLGNNLVGKGTQEEKKLKALRDRIEAYVAATPVLEELRARLKGGLLEKLWEEDELQDQVARVKEIMELASAAHPVAYDFTNPFDNELAKIFERLNTAHDINALRAVGRINPSEGSWQNQRNVDDRQTQYTLLYVLSKISGHKAESTDPVDWAAYHAEEYHRRLERTVQTQANWTAHTVHAAPQYNSALARLHDVPNTSLPLDEFLLRRDIEYRKSIFKKFVDQTLRNYERLPEAEARARQIHDEAHLYSVCYEALHYAKKCARMAPTLDATKVEQAIRKAIAQGVAAAERDLLDRSEGVRGLRYLLTSPILARKRYRPATLFLDSTLGGLLRNHEKPEQILDLQGPANVTRTLLATLGNIAQPVYAALNALPTGLMLRDLKSIRQEEFDALLPMASVKEGLGDAALAGTGLLLGSFSDFANAPDLMAILAQMDPKSFALINPLLGFLLQNPHIQHEAIRKCYGHVLANYAEKIAAKYALALPTMRLILKGRHLEKGEFSRNPRDSLYGPLAQRLYTYFAAHYNGTPTTEDKKFISNAERAERLILQDILVEEIALRRDRLALGTNDPAEHAKLERNLAELQEAKRALGSWSRHPLFTLAAKCSLTLRFGSIAALGTAMAFSSAGAEITTLPWLGTIWTSTLFGTNLALAGGASFLASLNRSLKKRVGTTARALRALRNLPYLAYDPARGWSIDKGQYCDPKTPEGTRQIRALIAGVAANPGLLEQIADCLVAGVVTPLKNLAHDKASSDAFARQHTATFFDATGQSLAALGGSLSWESLAQSGLAVSAMLLFMRVGLYNMMMFEIQRELTAHRVPNMETIKIRIAENLRQNTNRPFLSLLRNTADRTKNKPLGNLTKAVARAGSLSGHVTSATLCVSRLTSRKPRPRARIHPAPLRTSYPDSSPE